MGDLYIHLFEGILSEHPAAKHGREGIYFAENGEHSIYQVSKAIGDSLVEQGLLENPEPNVLTQEDIDIYFGVSFQSLDQNHILLTRPFNNSSGLPSFGHEFQMQRQQVQGHRLGSRKNDERPVGEYQT